MSVMMRVCNEFIQEESVAKVRCAVARVRAESLLKSVQDVRACGSFLGVRCATLLLHTFGTKLPENAIL